eukprot:TRINITY_DN28428_c0_g1_i2.p1 TRINITY_DN28428_c0_g1~~TRINITY_DN28428_c0_g1_i2.p1  ORF type:complete len:208 (-),score=56.42 TRINITY_DN28428_c0_g1_i2:416-1039(-)
MLRSLVGSEMCIRDSNAEYGEPEHCLMAVFNQIQRDHPVDEEACFMAMLDTPENRRQEIIPGLWLGNQVGAGGMVPIQDRTDAWLQETKAALKADSITHICCLAEGLRVYPDDFKYHNVTIADHPDSIITAHFEDMFNFIDQGLQEGGVLVHCNAGISRSGSTVVGYLMSRGHCKSYVEAVLFVRERRLCVNTTAFEDDLLQLEASL